MHNPNRFDAVAATADDGWWTGALPAERTGHEDHWLGPTRQLDIRHPKVHITAQKLTQAWQTHAARAAALHDFVRRMPFAAGAESRTLAASEVLRNGCGDCHSKGALFVALCRAAGLPARLLFVQVRPRFLAGILDDVPAALPHAVGQVMVDGRWRSTDGYVVDPVLFAQAKALLRQSSRECGWGIVRQARGRWDGLSESIHQFAAGDLLDVLGAVHDPRQFYATRAAHARGWVGRLRYAVGAHLVNRRVAQLRTRPATGEALAPAD
jgi:hypothetical protein